MDSSNNTTKTSPSGGRTVFYIFSVVIIVILALLLLTVVITKQSGEPVMLLKHGMMIIDTTNMGDAIPADSALILRQVDIDDLAVSDVIAVREQVEGKKGYTTISTQIVRLNPTPEGLTFITKGIASDTPDNRLRTSDDIYGKVVTIIPTLGKFLLFVKSPFGLSVCIAFPLALLLIIEIINLFRMSKTATREELIDSNPQNYAEMFGTQTIDFDTKPKTKNTRSDVSLDADKLRQNIGQKVRELKQTAVFIPSQDVAESVAPLLEQTQEFDVPQLASSMYSIVTRDDEQDFLEEEEFRAPRQFKIEPKNESRVRITPHKIITKAEEEAEMLSSKILSFRDDYLADEEIIQNMGQFEFERPADLFINSPDFKVKHPFSKKSAKLSLRNDENSEFTASVQSNGRDHFNIEGIDVRVKSNALRLNIGDENDQRDIMITVTEEYTNVVVGGEQYQVNFALFKDAEDNEQKVVIKKRNL